MVWKLASVSAEQPENAAQDPTALQIVAEHLTAMARQQYGSIAKALHVPKAQVLRSCELIRSLSPKPLNGKSRG